jgi:hypothetical protein
VGFQGAFYREFPGNCWSMKPAKTISQRWEKRGYRAEVRRERKKRDILSPVNVLKISSNTHQLRFNISNCPVRSNTIFKKTLNSVERVFASQDFLSNGTVRAYEASVGLGSYFSSKIFSEIKRKGLRQGGKED